MVGQRRAAGRRKAPHKVGKEAALRRGLQAQQRQAVGGEARGAAAAVRRRRLPPLLSQLRLDGGLQAGAQGLDGGI